MAKQANGLLSVIVPIYKVEPYLDRCIESIVRQTYTDLEIILVDDGSPDNCPQMCDDWAKKDPRIRVIHKKNGGLSDARNAGMDASSAELITFVDSDDFLTDTFIECLYDTLVETGADISICDYVKVSEDVSCPPSGGEKRGTGNIVSYRNVDCLQAMYRPRTHGMEFITCGKLYKKRLFTEHRIAFPVGMLHEDTFTTYKLLYFADKIAFIDLPNYCYRMREGSIMAGRYNPKHFDLVQAKEEECGFFADKDPVLFDCAVNSLFRSFVELYRNFSQSAPFDGRAQLLEAFLRNYRADCRKLLPRSRQPLAKKGYYLLFGYSSLFRRAVSGRGDGNGRKR